jgi:hypothetical protein
MANGACTLDRRGTLREGKHGRVNSKAAWVRAALSSCRLSERRRYYATATPNGGGVAIVAREGNG